jgi:hypothetical protein
VVFLTIFCTVTSLKSSDERGEGDEVPVNKWSPSVTQGSLDRIVYFIVNGDEICCRKEFGLLNTRPPSKRGAMRRNYSLWINTHSSFSLNYY